MSNTKFAAKSVATGKIQYFEDEKLLKKHMELHPNKFVEVPYIDKRPAEIASTASTSKTASTAQ